jgi:hypothetical protein
MVATESGAAPPVPRDELLNFDGWMTQEVYHAAFDHIATKFFSLPNYYLLPTKQPDGTVKECALFAFYILPNMLASLGEAGTIEALAHMRNATLASSGRCVHIQLMSPQPAMASVIADPAFGIDSHTVRGRNGKERR